MSLWSDGSYAPLSPVIPSRLFDIHFLPLSICTYGELWCYDTSHVDVFMVLIYCIELGSILCSGGVFAYEAQGMCIGQF